MREAARAARGTALALRDGRRVLVTCNAGRNRSGLVVVLALLALFPELAPADAVRIVRERRVSPDGARALTNEDFVRLAQRGRAILRSNQSANWEK